MRRLIICLVLLMLQNGTPDASPQQTREQRRPRRADATRPIDRTASAVARAAAVPPAGSPLARGEHPRVLITRAELPALRTRIATHARKEFQAFLAMLADPQLTRHQQAIAATWGAVNYAFVAALDPVELRRLGFTLNASLDSPEKLCRTAEGYVNTWLPLVQKRQAHDAFVHGYPNPLFLPVIVTYDWCYSYLSPEVRTSIVDAFVAKFTREYAGKNLLTVRFSNPWLANNQNAAKIHDALGILAFYGDSYPEPAVQQQMFDGMSTLWSERLMFELRQFYGEATGWHEGFGYFGQGFVSLGIGLSMIDSALGTNVFRTMPFFAQAPVFVSTLLSPFSEANVCGKGSEPCPRYTLKYGDTGGLPNLPCRTMVLMSGALRDANPANARLAKWLAGQPECGRGLTTNGGTWANAVLYQFIFGSQDVPAQAPDRSVPQATRFGLGMYAFRAGDTFVTTTSQPYGMYAHGDKLFGHFTIEKYGYLVLNAANNKGGEARIRTKGSNVFLNTLGIHKGADDAHYDENGMVLDPVFGARGLRARLSGRVLAERLDGAVNYVFADHGEVWNPATADVAQRELVSIIGLTNSEYVVVFDRMRVINPTADEKVWKIWVSAQPRFINGSVDTPRMGKWTSSTTDTLEVTNQLDNINTRDYHSAPTHGRLFLRTLSPDARIVNALGGPGSEFQSGNDDGTTPWGAPEMNDAIRSYLGWGRIEVRPSAARAYDTFLNVMQFGDSRSLSAMTPTHKIKSGDGGSVGVHIADPRRESVVMFVDDHAQVFKKSEVNYTFSRVGMRSSHFITDLASGDYYVSASTAANGGVTISVSKSPGGQRVPAVAGTVAFDLNGMQVVPAAEPGKPAANQ